MEKENGRMFGQFIGKEVKVLYTEHDQKRIARGKLYDEDASFIQISGRLGTLLINKKHIDCIKRKE